jgi:hypothetical protein
MIVATPSMMKNAVSTRVRERTPPTGHTSKRMPVTMASTAESNDHQKPGRWRSHRVKTSPTTPLTRKREPRKIATASDAIGGITIAITPRRISIKPSMR